MDINSLHDELREARARVKQLETEAQLLSDDDSACHRLLDAALKESPLSTMSMETMLERLPRLIARTEHAEADTEYVGNVVCGMVFDTERRNVWVDEHSTCAYCGAEDLRVGAVMRAHAESCAQHPMFALRAAFAAAHPHCALLDDQPGPCSCAERRHEYGMRVAEAVCTVALTRIKNYGESSGRGWDPAAVAVLCNLRLGLVALVKGVP